MKFTYLFPFAYFLDTRLRRSSVAFHVIFEWGAAVLIACVVGREPAPGALVTAAYSYLAFISLYEIGYLVNDLVSAKFEEGGRRRGPQDAGSAWVAAWVLTRIMVFLSVTIASNMWHVAAWWLFFGGLCVVFALHNIWTDREQKAATFVWLAWFRFLAPVAFVVRPEEFMGVALAAGMIYSGFRLFGYLDSKGLLQMPGRQRPQFRRAFLVMPLAAAIPLTQFEYTQGFVVLAFYFAAAAFVGSMVTSRGAKTTSSGGD